MVVALIRRRFDSFTLLLAFAATVGCGTSEEPPKNSSSAQTQWIDPRSVSPGPIRDDALSASQLDRLGVLQQTFSDVDSSPFDKWVEDFRRDQDPEREIRVYEAMAATYRAYCASRNLTLEEKLDVYQVVMLRSGASDNEVLSRMHLKVLAVNDAKDILKLYKAAPAPIEVSKTPVR